jgi:hypothetical protein
MGRPAPVRSLLRAEIMVYCSFSIALCGAAIANYFNGLGQLRTFQLITSTPPISDIGYLTDGGLWTDIEAEYN